MKRNHSYQVAVRWTGNKGNGTNRYDGYERSHVISIPDKADLHSSSDPAFRGDATKHNPEELLLAALSSCHMLWYLHLCADAGVIVQSYEDRALGNMVERKEGGGHFTEVILQPQIKVSESSMIPMAEAMHQKAGEYCFIAASVNFPVRYQAEISI